MRSPVKLIYIYLDNTRYFYGIKTSKKPTFSCLQRQHVLRYHQVSTQPSLAVFMFKSLVWYPSTKKDWSVDILLRVFSTTTREQISHFVRIYRRIHLKKHRHARRARAFWVNLKASRLPIVIYLHCFIDVLYHVN